VSTIVDASGLSCPQPVLMTLGQIQKSGSGEIIVLVDTVVSKENVGRAATSQGWEVKNIEEEGEGYRITIAKD